MAEINYDKILDELESLMANNPKGFTIQEMAAATGKTPQHCREKMRLLIDKGIAGFAGHRKVVSIDGKHACSPVYEYMKK